MPATLKPRRTKPAPPPPLAPEATLQTEEMSAETDNLIQWGVPYPKTATVAWAARAILRASMPRPLDILHDRQAMVSTDEAKKTVLCEWLNTVGIRDLQARGCFDPADGRMWNMRWLNVPVLGTVTARLSPRASHGYLYITIYA